MTTHTKRTAIGAAVACALALSASGAGAATRSTTISGTLDRSGYTVIALGYNGQAVSSRSRSFRLKAPDRLVTLQLVDRHGRYAGPVVIGGSRGKVLVGVRAGAVLGTIRVYPSAGFARALRSLPVRWVDRKRYALARRGMPLGNGRNFGLVRSPGHAAAGPGLDQDRDGVPDALDVDANGNGILNPLDQPTPPGPHGKLSAAQTGTVPAPETPAAAPGQAFNWMSQIFLDLSQTLNADAAGVTPAEIDSMLVAHLNLKGLNVPQGDLVELNCNGLTYCSPGGTGQVVAGQQPNPTTAPFPSCCDPDGNGFGNLRGPGAPPLTAGPGGEELSLNPNATSAQIGSGDTIVVRVTSNGRLTQTPVPIDFVFNTVPALQRYSDGAGDAGTISYPASTASPGTLNNPIALAAGPNGDIVMQLTVWRPQRRGIAGAGEPAFMDVGHLSYALDVPPQAPIPRGANPAPQCSAASVSSSDPSLSGQTVPLQNAPSAGVFVDSADDRPASPANTLSMTVDLTRCLTDKGASGFPVGSTIDLEVEADAQGSSDHANQQVWVRRVR